MTLNISDLRRDCDVVSNFMSPEELGYSILSPKDGLIRLETAVGNLVPYVPKLLDIAEAVKRGMILHDRLNDGIYRTDAEFEKKIEKLADCNKGIRELFEDVEVGDAD